MPNTHRWIGQALPVKQVDTITIANDWADNDTVTITIGDRSLVITVVTGGTPTVNDVASIIAAAINAGSATANTQYSETRNVGGQEIPQMRRVTATVDTNVVTVTAVTAGHPFVMSVTEVTATTGTATEATATEATGPNHAGNVDNWDTKLSGLANADTLRCDNGNIPILYQMGYFRDNTYKVNFERTTRYKGRIGLAKYNSAGYQEYLDRFWEHYDNDGSTTITLETDPTDLEGGITQLDLDDQTVSAVNIRGTGHTVDKNCVIIGGAYTLNAGGGNIEIGPDYETAPGTAAAVTVVAGSENQTPNQLNIVLGPHSGIANGAKTLTALGGKIHVLTPLYVDGSNRCTVNCYEGAEIIYDSPGGGTYIVNGYGGIFRWILNGSATAQNTITVWTGATWDTSGGTANPTYASSFNVYGGANIIYGGSHPSNDWTLQGCRPEQVNAVAA